MNQPEIYSPISAPMPGEVSTDSIRQRNEPCAKCGIADHQLIYDPLILRLDYWAGEDLMKFVAGFVVTERLRAALLEARISGATYDPVQVSIGDGFKFRRGAYLNKELPTCYLVNIHGAAIGPETWWESRSHCDICGRHHWKMTIPGIRANRKAFPVADPIKRTVIHSSWDGSDIFTLQEPGPPVVTQSFIDVLSALSVKEVDWRTAAWQED